MKGLHQYLAKLNTLEADSNQIAKEELIHIKDQFKMDLDDYSKRKYLWKLIATRYFLKDEFLNLDEPLGLEQTLQSLETSNVLDKEVAWNAINVLYAPLMNNQHWIRVLDAVNTDFNMDIDNDQQTLMIIKTDLLGLNNNFSFITESTSSYLKDVCLEAIEWSTKKELCREILTLIGILLSFYKSDFVPDLGELVNKVIGYLESEPLTVIGVLNELLKVSPKQLNFIQGQLLEYYSVLSTKYVHKEGIDFHGVVSGWEMINITKLLIDTITNGVFDGETYIALLKKITNSIIYFTEQELTRSKDKHGKLLMGSIYLNTIHLRAVLGDKSCIKSLLSSLESHISQSDSIFMDNAFKSELIGLIIKLHSLDPSQIDVILRYGKLWKKLLHSKDEEICYKIEELALQLSKQSLSFTNAKIILVILFDKFVRVNDKRPLLKLILEVMNNQMKSGVVRYSILKLIKCWITLGPQGDEYWESAFKMITICVSNPHSGTNNGELSEIQVGKVDSATHDLRSQIIEFIYLGLLSMPDDDPSNHESFLFLTLSVLTINAQTWHIGDVGKQINALIQKYSSSSSNVKRFIMRTFVAYYPFVDSKYKYAIIDLLSDLARCENKESALAKTGRLCFYLLEAELRFLKFDQGILVDSDDIGVKIMYRVKSENDIVSVTFNCICNENFDEFEISINPNGSNEHWEICNEVVGSIDPDTHKAKGEFQFKVKSLYDIQDEPLLQIKTNRGIANIRACILLKLIDKGSLLTKPVFEARCNQVISALGKQAMESRKLQLHNLSVDQMERLVTKLGFGLVSTESNDTQWEICAAGLFKSAQNAIGVLIKITNQGQLTVLTTQSDLSHFIASRLEMVFCSTLHV